MADCQERRVWLYESCGEDPQAAVLPAGVKAEASADEGRWRGQAACEDDSCPLWCCDIDPEALATSAPLECPTCEIRSGWPELVWRSAIIVCGECKKAADYSLLNPADEWPTEIQCAYCESSDLKTPAIGLVLRH